MLEVEKVEMAAFLRREAEHLRITAREIAMIADRLDPPPSLPEPSRSSHQS